MSLFCESRDQGRHNECQGNCLRYLVWYRSSQTVVRQAREAGGQPKGPTPRLAYLFARFQASHRGVKHHLCMGSGDFGREHREVKGRQREAHMQIVHPRCLPSYNCREVVLQTTLYDDTRSMKHHILACYTVKHHSFAMPGLCYHSSYGGEGVNEPVQLE